jgi:hypothetical protein
MGLLRNNPGHGRLPSLYSGSVKVRALGEEWLVRFERGKIESAETQRPQTPNSANELIKFLP